MLPALLRRDALNRIDLKMSLPARWLGQRVQLFRSLQTLSNVDDTVNPDSLADPPAEYWTVGLNAAGAKLKPKPCLRRFAITLGGFPLSTGVMQQLIPFSRPIGSMGQDTFDLHGRTVQFIKLGERVIYRSVEGHDV